MHQSLIYHDFGTVLKQQQQQTQQQQQQQIINWQIRPRENTGTHCYIVIYTLW